MKLKVVATYLPKPETIHGRQRGALRAVGCVDQLIPVGLHRVLK